MSRNEIFIEHVKCLFNLFYKDDDWLAVEKYKMEVKLRNVSDKPIMGY